VPPYYTGCLDKLTTKPLDQIDRVDRASPTPLFRQIGAALMGQIQSGQLRQGDVIPSEHELSATFKVSRMTVRAAVDQLVLHGMVERRQGRGTIVMHQPVVKSARIIGFTSFSDEMRTLGLMPSSAVTIFTDCLADPAVAAQLGLSPGAPVIYLERVRLASGEPMALEKCHLPYARFAGLMRFDFSQQSLYDVLEREFAALPSTCEESVEAIALEPNDAALLRVRPGTPALRVQRITRDAHDQLIETEQTTFRADRYRMLFLRRRETAD